MAAKRLQAILDYMKNRGGDSKYEVEGRKGEYARRTRLIFEKLINFMIIDRLATLVLLLIRVQGSQMQATHKKTEEKRESSLYKTLTKKFNIKRFN